MNDFNLDSVIKLLEQAKEQGVSVSLVEEELSVRFQKGQSINKSLLEQLKINKPFLLHYFKNYAAKSNTLAHTRIQKTERAAGEGLPVSYAQERLWFIDQLEGSVQYHIPSVLTLKGTLNTTALEEAIQRVVNRHEVLRTTVRESSGKALQFIGEPGRWRLLVVDGSAYSDQEEALDNYIQQLINTPFDLSKDHMIRAHLVTVQPQHHILVVTLHHIAADGWSASIIVRELVAIYNAIEQGHSHQLPPLAIQYADYANWQRSYLQGETLEKKLTYWKQQLKNVATLQLPGDFERPAIQSSRGDAIQFSIDKELTSKLQLLSQQQDATLFMTILAAFNVLLYRYSGQQDICVGTPIAGRDQQETEALIGFFINSLALRNRVDSQHDFTSLLHQVKATTLEAYDNKELPFEKVVDAIVTERNLSRSPIFQVMFALQNMPAVPAFRLGEVEMSQREFDNETSKFDLAFFFTETGGGLSASVRYCTDLYKEATIQQLVDHFKRLLQSIVDEPLQNIGVLPLLATTEVEQLLVGFNQRNTDYPRDKTIIQVLEAQVLATPEATALVFEKEVLSYRELNERANRLAHFLIAKGIVPESFVAISIERSVEMMVGIIGILKAGAVYVPIDASYPVSRVQWMLEDTAATCMLTTDTVLSKLTLKEQPNCICLDTAWDTINQYPLTNPAIPTTATQLAYIIYTSGSTGTPKGVMVTQRNVVSLVKGVDYVDFSPGNVLLSTGSSSFDATTFEYWGMLLNGGRLVLSTEEKLLDHRLLKALIVEQGVNMMWFTSSWFNQLVEADIHLFASLQTIVAGGEKLSAYHVEKLRQAYPDIAFINGYGPTENTTFSLTCQVKEQKVQASIPIGRPLNNRSAIILDENLQLVPVGVSGELFLGGEGLSAGYLNQPGLTKEKFIANPFDEKNRERLYRTGDIGRWRADGNIEYQGRRDEQVKIRGYRIELGEIAAALLQHPAIQQAVVMAREDMPGIKRLVAYVVVEGTLDKDALSTFLQDRLPAYMVPAIWVAMQQLPLTANGKIDSQSLPAPEMSTLSSNTYTAPRNETEAQLCGIWKELLQQERVGIHDNFFELGGDSILTIQVVSRARRQGMELQPKDLFVHQTIARLSAAIADRSGTIITGEQGLLTGEAGLLPIQQWWLEMDNGNYHHFNQSVLLGLDKAILPIHLQATLQQVMEQHDALRCTYHRQEGEWQQVYGRALGEVVIEDLQELPTEQLVATIGEKASHYQQSLNITNGELVKVVLFQTPSALSHNRLLIIIHHLAVDGVSWRILLEDMERILDALKAATAPTALPKTSSMRQWYQALESWGQRRRVQAQANYWRQAGKSYYPLPVDKASAAPVKVKDITQHTQRLATDQTTRLLQEVPRVYHTEINDLLLAALAATIGEWSNTTQVNIGLEGHGREDIGEGLDTSRTIGWFTSLYPLQLVLPSHPGAADLIKSVKEQLRQVPDKGLGYGVLKYINREPSLQGNEPWDIVFNYLGQLDNVVRESNLFTGAGESQGAGRSSEQPVAEKIALNSSVRGGQLVVSWSYSQQHYHEATIQQLAAAYIQQLEKIIAHCQEQLQSRGPVFTPADYGLAGEISYVELDDFLKEEINGKERRHHLEGLYRLSGLQEGMLFHGLYDVKIGAYMEQFGCELFGVQLETLEKSWAHMIRRHSILRSAFYVDALSVPVQCVHKEVDLPLVTLDYRGMTDEEQLAAIKAFDEEDKNQGFDFKMAPLMRLALFRLSEDRYRMLWTSHHILFDGWSFPILMEEFLTTYELLEAGGTPVVTEEDRYEDYIRYIEQTDKEQEEQYWRNYLQGLQQSTLLPFINSTIERNKGKGKYEAVGIHIDAIKTAGIQQFAHRHRITLNTIMQGVWAYLLYRYTGNKNIVYGIIVSGRPDDLSGVEQRVGMYINTLPLHAVLNESMGVTEWLQALQAEQVNSRQFQHTPFPVVQGWSGVPGDLFDTLLTFENYPFSKVITKKKWALNVGNVDMQDHTNYPLSIVIGSSDQVNIRFSYNAGLLDTAYVKEIRNHFENVLLQIIESGDKKIETLNLLTQAEQQQLLVSFNDTVQPLPTGETVVQLFEAQAAKNPDAIALVYTDKTITYRELNARSNQLANGLSALGVKAETCVPLCTTRSIDMVIGILGILKAGGAYVPIDPEYPQERIRFILEDTGASLLVTHAATSTLLKDVPGIQQVGVDEVEKLTTDTGTGNLDTKPLPGQLAYIIYTSGSTGKPKGVMIEHGNLLSYLVNNKTNYTGETAHRAGSYIHLSYTFDASVTALFMPLLQGKLAVIAAKQSVELFEDPNLLEYAPYDFIKITPAHLELIQPAFVACKKGLLADKLVIGGEALRPGQFNAWLAAGIDVEVVNEYGPTEATVGCTTFSFLTITDKEAIRQGISIGKPIDRATIYILDELQRPVPVGVKGELHIGGAGIARGYLNRPDLTAERFVADPFSHEPGAIMYKTGDIARWVPDGNIDFQGRTDDQVKIRGYRIEPGEVEQVLQSCESVSQGVVLAKADKDGSMRLVSYFVPLPAVVKMKERELNFQRVASWKELYEVEYGQTENDDNVDPEFNIIGWNDSFTGGAIAPGQMKAWLDDIVKVVLAEKPGVVLEVGCGTGLIYYQLAGKVDKYIGCDLSRSSINQIKQHISKGLRDYGATELFTAPAHEVAVAPGQEVNTILLNSMVQYFPGEDYMNIVLDKCMAMLNGKGRIIIGDVRDNRLLPLFKARLSMQKLQDGINLKEFSWGLEQDIIKEEELCFSPSFFYQLRDKFPQITQVELVWKDGQYINELSLYRYTAIIYVGIEKESVIPQWQAWSDLDQSGINSLLQNFTSSKALVAIRNVPNPRLWKERLLQSSLNNTSYTTVGDLLQATEAPGQEAALVPQLLVAAIANGYQVKQLLNEDPLAMNLVFYKIDPGCFIQSPTTGPQQPSNFPPTNIPLFTDISFLLQKEIRDAMVSSLPDYMVPSEMTALRQLPLTVNGKVDRIFLSQREERVFANSLNYLPPSTHLEKALAEIWKDLLHLERVGIEDDFFDLGGHSLLAMRVIAAIRKELEVELNIKELFIHPTIGSLARHIQKMSKGLLLPAITKIQSRPGRIPLSFSQERLWFIDQLDGSLQYHIPAVLKLTGRLDIPALQGVLQEIVNRHEVLRTVIKAEAGEGYQVIKPAGQWRLAVTDGSRFLEDEAALQEYIRSQVTAPFNLSEDDMLRATLLKLSATNHLLVATLHHIASDGWSTSILVNEMAALYNAAIERKPASLPVLPVQYADVAIWQRTYLQGEAWEKKLDYWKTTLEGVATLHLPIDFARPLVQTNNGAIRSVKLDQALSQQLQTFSQQQGTTLYMTLLAAFNVLMHRYTGQTDICVGTPIAGRQQQETAGLIGFFVNTLALRNEVDGNTSFVELLQQVKNNTLDAYDHQEVPFEKVVELVVKERDMSRSPLFQVVFALQNTPEIQALRLGELQLSRGGKAGAGHHSTTFELSFITTETPTGVHLSIEYSTDLFREQTILNLAAHYTNLLCSIVQAPQEAIGALPMLEQSTIDHLLYQLNDTKKEFPAGKTLLHYFAEQVSSQPGAIALLFGKASLTYAQLDQRSNQVANYLQTKGVGVETLVPVCMNRGITLVTCLLGILKAGGAYVPIDPGYPADRIAYMLTDTGAAFVVTTGDIKPLLPQLPSVEIIEADTLSSEIAGFPVSALGQAADFHQLAYVIYTSGSSGRPKGVQIEHGALANLVCWHREAYQVGPSSRATAMAGVGFDAFGWEVWPYLCFGGRLVIIDDAIRTNTKNLLILLKNQEITHLFSATALVPELVKELGNKDICLQFLLTGGDKLATIDSTSWPFQLVNNYGPTENTVVTTWYPMCGNQHLVPPIGKPIANAAVYLLNAQSQLVPEGVAGEIVIGGAGLARGYLNRPDLTESLFIPNRFSGVAGEKLYRSGDLGRWLPDGNIEYLGRIDEQVKIRGYRVELGEIEHALQESGLVEQGIVLAKTNIVGNKRLIGYVIPGKLYSPGAMISFLKTRLPEYMIPAVWVPMEHFPLTANGKINRRALPDMDTEKMLSNQYVAPQTEMEIQLAAIWMELLGVEKVGINDNFFELGGHSLLAMRMVAYIEKTLLITIPIKVLFQFTSISDLSKYLEIQQKPIKDENITAYKVFDV